jgi:hypothetical protein
VNGYPYLCQPALLHIELKIRENLTKSTQRIGEPRNCSAALLTATLVCVLVIVGDLSTAWSSPSQTAAAGNPDTLLTLAKKAGFEDLTDCEQNLLKSTPTGDTAYCQFGNIDSSKGDEWPESVRLRAKLIRWLCVNEPARQLLDPKGILIYGAKIPDQLDLDFVSLPFAINIVKSRFSAGMSLMGAKLTGLNLAGSFLKNPNGVAVEAGRVNVAGGSVFLSSGFESVGEVDLTSAIISGNLDCDGGSFINPKGTALEVNNASVTGSVYLRYGFKSLGEVDLGSAIIGSNLECEHAIFINHQNSLALSANRASVAGSILLRNRFKAMGVVELGSATIRSQLSFVGALFANGSAVDASGANVGGAIWWTSIGTISKGLELPLKSPDVALDLTDASAESWIDDEASWPQVGNLHLSGFKYNHLEMISSKGAFLPRDGDSALKWVRLQNSSAGLETQPYQQLAKVLESEGDDHAARKIRIAMEDDLSARLPWYRRIWPWIKRHTIAYGYEPWLALWWAGLFVLLGYFLFALGYRAGVIAPTDKDAFAGFQEDKLPANYQTFNAFFYSLDTFLPIINLGLKDRWMPDPSLTPRTKALTGIWLDCFGSCIPQIADGRLFKWGKALRVYFWFHLLVGWVLITLFAAGLTGIIKG